MVIIITVANKIEGQRLNKLEGQRLLEFFGRSVHSIIATL